MLASGVVATARDLALDARVQLIYDGVDRLLAEHAPAVLVLEDLYTEYRFPRTALLMAHARGVVCLAARQRNVAVLPLIDDVVASLSDQLSRFAVETTLSRDDLSLHCDRGLTVALLTQYLDNAAKYSDAGTVITIRAAEHETDVVFCVHSYGPVIPPADLELVFDRFYRSSVSENKVPGTGIGLSVAKRSAQVHGGHVWVTSDAAKGTAFFASIPQQGACS